MKVQIEFSKLTKLVEDTNSAYLTGIIDGEGCFHIAQNKNSKSITLYISVANTNFSLLEWLKVNYGGSIHHMSKKPKHKQAYNWQVGKKDEILPIIDKILPFLIIKREQALLLKKYYINFTELKLLIGNARTSEMNKRLAYKEEMNKLNKRGE